MKRVLALLLLAVMVVGLFGCGKKEAQQQSAVTEGGFRVGYCKVNITPEERVGLGGYSNTKFRTMETIGDDMYATAVAFTDENDNTVIMINTDLLRSYQNYNPTTQSRIAEAVGIPAEQIIITCNHSHSVPDLNFADPAIERYREMVYNRITDAAIKAMEDRKPATLATGSIEAEGLNFVRHYWAENIYTGERVMLTDNFGDATNTKYVGHAAEADPTLHMIRIAREGEKDILFTNWRAHPHWTGGTTKYVLSSDFIGPYRESLEAMTGADVVYFQGAAGNINEKSRINSENKSTDYRAHGNYLAEYAYECYQNNLTEVDSGKIKFNQINFQGTQREKPDYQLYIMAKQVGALWSQTGSSSTSLAGVDRKVIHSVYHASALQGHYTRKEEDCKMLISAISIGDTIGFVTFPGEAYDTIAEYVEENSPYDFNIFLGYAVQHLGYLPNEAAWEYGCYEVDITRWAKGFDVTIQEQYVSMLNELYNT